MRWGERGQIDRPARAKGVCVVSPAVAAPVACRGTVWGSEGAREDEEPYGFGYGFSPVLAPAAACLYKWLAFSPITVRSIVQCSRVITQLMPPSPPPPSFCFARSLGIVLA